MARSRAQDRVEVSGKQQRTNSTLSLCAETQGRQIVAALVNEAMEEALGLAFARSPARQGGKPGQSNAVKPSE